MKTWTEKDFIRMSSLRLWVFQKIELRLWKVWYALRYGGWETFIDHIAGSTTIRPLPDSDKSGSES